MIVGRGAVYRDPKTDEDVYADYMGALYPSGINPQTTIFFQHENIDTVIFKGYEDDEEARFLEILSNWQSHLTVRRAD